MDLETVRAFMEQHIPFNRFLGLRVDALGDGFARLRIPFREELVGDMWRPALHGGVISTLVDTTGGAAAFTTVGPEDRVSTVDLRVDYLRPGGMADLVAEGRVIRTGNRVSVVQIAVLQPGSDEPVADGRAVYNIRRGSA